MLVASAEEANWCAQSNPGQRFSHGARTYLVGQTQLRRGTLEAGLIRALWPAALAFASAASQDGDWWAAIDAVRRGDRSAADVARFYAREHAAYPRFAGQHEDETVCSLQHDEPGLIEQLAAEAQGADERAVLWDTLATISAFENAPVPSGLPQNTVRERKCTQAKRGAELVLLRGARRCLACGRPLGKNHRRNIDGRPGTAWNDYCPACERPPTTSTMTSEQERRAAWKEHDLGHAHRIRVDRAAIDAVLDDLMNVDPALSRASHRRRARLSA